MPKTVRLFQIRLIRQWQKFYRRAAKHTPSQSSASSAQSLLKYAGSWAGDDLEHCLNDVIRLRGEAVA